MAMTPTSNTTWKEWVSPYPTNKYIITNTSNATWDYWNTTATTTATNIDYQTIDIWGKWNGQNYTYKVPEYRWFQGTNTTTDTWEVWAKQVEYRVKQVLPVARQVLREVDRRRIEPVVKPPINEARAKARLLLLQNLSTKQRKSMDEKGFFQVRAQSGKIYRIYTNRSDHNNVYELDRVGNEVKQLCAQPRGGQPYEDSWLAQKLTLECAEDAFLDAAYQVEIRRARAQGAVCNVA